MYPSCALAVLLAPILGHFHARATPLVSGGAGSFLKQCLQVPLKSTKDDFYHCCEYGALCVLQDGIHISDILNNKRDAHVDRTHLYLTVVFIA